MNKLIRLILYITAGCIGIGVAALISGLVLGGGNWDWEETGMFGRAERAVQRITSGHGKQVKTVDKIEDTYDYDEDDDSGDDFAGDMGLLAIDASSITDLSIELRHGYLSIEESDDSRIIVSASGSQMMMDEIQAECDGGKISIRDTRSGDRSREDLEIYLEIPKNLQLNQANFQINAGVLESDCSFQAKELTVNADAGQIDLSDVTAGVFSASVGAGEMDIENGNFETTRLECGVGVMDIEADITKDAQIECGMGSVNLELAGGPDSVNYVLHCGAGTIEVGDRSYSGLAKKSRIENGSGATFTLECGMGQICIE